ncbi:MAG: hotdog domain-containing protein [Lapillicoccus sp.]
MTADPTRPRAHRLAMSVLMTPAMANFSGNVHGGAILKLLDEVAYACAAQYAGPTPSPCPWTRLSSASRPAGGELVTFEASVNDTGRTSMEVGIRVTTQDVRAGVIRHTNSCYVTLVAMGDDGRPAQVPPLVPRTPTKAETAEE